MIHSKTISLVIPCKNEEKGIAKLIARMPAFIDEIIVVDNGSTDNTALEAKKAGAIVVTDNRKQNGIGYGFAHMTGISVATGDYIAAMDGDDTYPAEAIAQVVDYMNQENLNFVSCNRFPLKSQAISKTRQLGVFVLNLEVKLLYGYPMKDILTGMWVMDAKAARTLELREGDWNLSPEIKLAAIKHPAIAFGQYHIDHFEREGESKQNIWKTGFNHLCYILKRRLTTDNFVYGFLASMLRETRLILRMPR